MKLTGYREKWGAGILGLVLVALLVNLIVQLKRPRPGSVRGQAKVFTGVKLATPPADKATAGRNKELDELSRYDPALALDLLKELDARPLPDLKRNPFEFVMPPAKAAPLRAAAASAPQPPPPPPVTLKPLGYSEGGGGVKEAMVSNEDQILIVRPGDSVGTRYKIIKITSKAITVEDAIVHQTIDLPIPQ
jgi:hypothetical protein